MIWYIEKSFPKERFLSFLPNCGHIGEAIAKALLECLDMYNIDIDDCRGQSYDNVANMTRKYNGMEALIKRKNELAVFVPCCGHSLNLVGKAAAICCSSAIQFFDFVENLYAFFTATRERYNALIERLSNEQKYFYT